MSSLPAVSFESAFRPVRRFRRVLSQPICQALSCPVILAALCGVLFFYGLAAGDLWRTEALRAIIGAEMLRTGNWIVPMLYGEPLFTKPPGMYAAIALCSWPFGDVTEWTARLPSALAATATVFLMYWYVGRQLGRGAGFLAALILPLSPLWIEKASSAEIDMLQVAWTTAAIVFFLRAVEFEPRKAVCRSALSWWLASFLCVAGGVLTKWTTPLFFYGAVLPLLWWRGRLRLLFSKEHLLGAALAMLLCFTWLAAAIFQQGWNVVAATIHNEAMQRLHPSYDPRPYPWKDALLHPIKILIVTLPFSFLAPWTLRPSFWRLWDARGRKLLQALHCWTWPNILLMSLPQEHSPRHSFPLFPGLAGLAALAMLAWMEGKLKWTWPRVGPQKVLVAIVFLWISLKIAYVEVVAPERTNQRQTHHKGALLAALVPLNQILYIFGVKDEGVMFYYGREVIRLHSPEQLPAQSTPIYCLLLPAEVQDWQDSRSIDFVKKMSDAQGDPILLVRVTGS